MRKSQIILLTVFAAGALLTGIGAGVAFGEYSSMKYDGIVVMGEENMVTDTITCQWEPEEEGSLLVNLSHYPPHWNVELVQDEAMPVGELDCEFTYNKELYKPHASVDVLREAAGEESGAEESGAEEPAGKENGEQEPAGRLELWLSYEGNEFDMLMEYKDDILNMLKERKLASYEIASVESVKIRLHPDMMEYLEVNE